MHESEGSWAARMRLAELGDSSVDHTWLWRLNPRHGATLEADEYIDSVRFRLGCAGSRGAHHLCRLQFGHPGHRRSARFLLRSWRGYAGTQRRLVSSTRSSAAV